MEFGLDSKPAVIHSFAFTVVIRPLFYLITLHSFILNEGWEDYCMNKRKLLINSLNSLIDAKVFMLLTLRHV